MSPIKKRKESGEDKVFNECTFHQAKRTAFIAGEVNEIMHRQFADFLLGLGNDPVDIFFSTTGGDVNSALGIYDLIRQHGSVKMIVNGECSSAGTFILQAAAIRTSTESSQFLVHYGTEETSDRATLKHNRKVEKYWFEIIAKRTGASMRRVRRWHSGETYFNASEAVAAGLIDGIQ